MNIIGIQFIKFKFISINVQFLISFEKLYYFFLPIILFSSPTPKKSELNLSLPTFYYYFTYGGKHSLKRIKFNCFKLRQSGNIGKHSTRMD